MTERRQLHAAIIGAGLMGFWHARAVKRAGGVIAAVIDSDAERGARLAAMHGARSATTLSGAAAHGAIDVAHVCTPLDTHVALARDAIALGIHALVEKPLASTGTDTADLLVRAEKQGVLLCPVHQFPFQRGVRDIHAAIPRIGPVLHVQFTACSAGADGDRSGAARRDEVAEDILPHPLSLVADILDAPLADAAWDTRRPAPGELVAIGKAGSATISMTISMAGRPTNNAMNVIGARGTAHADLFHGFAVIESGRVSRARKILHPFTLGAATTAGAFGNLARRLTTSDPAYPGLRELVAAFYSAVRGGAPSPVTASRTLDLARARDAVIADLRKGV